MRTFSVFHAGISQHFARHISAYRIYAPTEAAQRRSKQKPENLFGPFCFHPAPSQMAPPWRGPQASHHTHPHAPGPSSSRDALPWWMSPAMSPHSSRTELKIASYLSERNCIGLQDRMHSITSSGVHGCAGHRCNLVLLITSSFLFRSIKFSSQFTTIVST